MTNKKFKNEKEKEKVIFQENEEIKKELERIKELSINRHYMTTVLRRPRRKEVVIFINPLKRIYTIQRIKRVDAQTLETQDYIYPLSMTLTIALKKAFYIPFIEEPYKQIHICLGDTKSLDVSNQISSLANSEFIKSLLRYKEEKKLTDTFIFRTTISAIIFGFIFYLVLMNVLKKVIFNIIGEFTIKPPEET